MLPAFELLARHQHSLADSIVTWFDLPTPSKLTKPTDSIYSLFWQPHNQAQPEDSAWPTSALNILFFPKAKNRLTWWLQRIGVQLQGQQRLWVVGENNAGIKSLPKQAAPCFDAVKLDSARRCSLYELLPHTLDTEAESWQSFRHQGLKISSLPGVFSAARLDRGTAVLLSALPDLTGEILEFGCGSGIVTAVLARQSTVTQITAIDHDLLAIRSARKTLRDNGLDAKSQCLWSDGTKQLQPQLFTGLVTNPPFHQGIKTAYAASEEFFRQADQWLALSGNLIWVANDFINYQKFLTPGRFAVKRLTQSDGFNVFVAQKQR